MIYDNTIKNRVQYYLKREYHIYYITYINIIYYEFRKLYS